MKCFNREISLLRRKEKASMEKQCNFFKCYCWIKKITNTQGTRDTLQWETTTLLYLFQAEENLSQLSLHTKGWLQRPPVDPVLFTPWGRPVADKHKKESLSQRLICEVGGPRMQRTSSNDYYYIFFIVTRIKHWRCRSCSGRKKKKWVEYLDLQDWKTLRRVAKSFKLPLLAARALCCSSASFCFSGLPVGGSKATGAQIRRQWLDIVWHFHWLVVNYKWFKNML